MDSRYVDNKKTIAVIPARYESSRFPGKPLANILGKPMIQWVYERVLLCPELHSVYVATDDVRIFDCVKSFGGDVIMTGECRCGTDRVYQAIKGVECDLVINIQGDEPSIDPKEIHELLVAFRDTNVQMATLRRIIDNSEEIDNPNVVKVVTDHNGDAMFFSRSRIPYNGRSDNDVKYYKHIGIYAYTKDFLNTFVKLRPSTHESIEKLEQLRALDHGYKIRVMETDCENIGVDLESDISKVEKVLKTKLL